MRSTLLMALVALVALPLTSDTKPKSADPNVSGVYSCEGKSPDGRPYHGTVEIARLEDTYRIRWSIEGSEGVMRVIGVGIFSNGVLAASYFGGAPGIAVYKPDGTKLVGQWTIGGADGTTYPETLTRMADQHITPPQPREPPPPPRRPASVRPAVLGS